MSYIELEILGGGGTSPPYKGEYIVTPSMIQQTLPTEGFLMEQDVTVNAIQKTEIDNLNGTTLIIAS